MAEQLGFDQGFRNRRTVHRDQRRLGALRQVVQGAGDQFLAGAGLALDQYRGVGRRDLANLAVQLLHRRTGADDAYLAVGCRRAGAALAAGLAAVGGDRGRAAVLLAVLEDARHGLEHFVVVERLGDVVHRAHLHRIHRRTQAGVAGHDQNRNAFGELDQFGAGGARQAQVADHHVEGGDGVALLGFLHRAGFADLVLVALQQASQCRSDNGFVFDDQNMCHVFSSLDVLVYSSAVGPGCRGRVTRKRVPPSRW
ncbi:hypothetical protein PAERUG_P45_London_17_VIM_2_12_12_01636 [Pseudomonas aeruginosa]|nr:hypothetical protein PAERUG_P45_London_17_VIM_2_12_12_01636 [Pseudomonas aeruginosa]CRR02000.1 hypothetical protein PAERUG_E16_London_17_VIM_2_04_14_04012 [Pseudomonas aeruginosa]CRS22436.1 hypothetical protein PAERUG_P48_London_17_VIM_2_01_13_05753 [Pseudomonas aeruginosa]